MGNGERASKQKHARRLGDRHTPVHTRSIRHENGREGYPRAPDLSNHQAQPMIAFNVAEGRMIAAFFSAEGL